MRKGAKWYCGGCKKWHSWSQWVAGQNHVGDWCRASIVRGIADRRNDLPRYDYDHAQAAGRRSARRMKNSGPRSSRRSVGRIAFDRRVRRTSARRFASTGRKFGAF